MNRNRCSRSTRIGVHVEPESAFTFDRNPHAEDIRAANDALDELAAEQDELVPAEVAHRLLQDEEPRLRIWREHRGLTQTELGAISGVQQGYIAQIESGRKTGSIETLKKLSHALRIDIDDLVAPG